MAAPQYNYLGADTLITTPPGTSTPRRHSTLFRRPQRITQHPPIIATPSDQCILGAAHTLTTVRLTQRIQTSYVYGAMLNNGRSTLWVRTRQLHMPPPSPSYGSPHASPHALNIDSINQCTLIFSPSYSYISLSLLTLY